MIRINQLKLPLDHSREDVRIKAARVLGVRPENILDMKIVKRSLDARKKEEIRYIYTADVRIKGEASIIKRIKDRNISLASDASYHVPPHGHLPLEHPPVVVGSGPAGLFCALLLAEHGYCPIVLERGRDVDRRTADVETYWRGGDLDENSNVQFGEGGAGTFSDGKLNTLVKDSGMRNKKVLETFVEFGADPSLLIDSRPHIGTDVLCGIVKRIRQRIVSLGGEVRFETQATDFFLRDGRITALEVKSRQRMEAEVVVLAVGHSARDTFQTLFERNVPMRSKSFAVGVRVQHPQELIDLAQYGGRSELLGAASYKLTWKAGNERGVYSFCMCPGGYVVDSSSERGMISVNGMSNHARDGENANSAIIVSVTPEDYPDLSPLGGVAFQRELERTAFRLGRGCIPVQLLGDFRAGRISAGFGDVKPELKGLYQMANLNDLFPHAISEAVLEGMAAFDRVIPGFGRADAILAGVESRTSSPVRIDRGEDLQSPVAGLYPCGEGAGYAGGITSAAMDGLKVAEKVISKYASLAPRH